MMNPDVGNYMVTITLNGVSDPDTMTVSQGMDSTLLLTFTAGITTDPNGPNPNGIRVIPTSSTDFKVLPQAAHIDHSTGILDGTISGMGTLTPDGTVTITFNYSPTNGAVTDADGGVIAVPDGGTTQVLTYMVSGSRE